MQANEATYDGQTGTAGGAAFGAALARLIRERDREEAAFAAAAAFSPESLAAVIAGAERVTVPQLARLARALKLPAVEFLQQADLLSLTIYALGLDPLFFLPEGMLRKDARIYMREINPRHAVPERDMLSRNPVLKALSADPLLDDLGRLEILIAYLLRAAIEKTGGTL